MKSLIQQKLNLRFQNDFTDKLLSAEQHFTNLFDVCNKKWNYGCGSYLFNGKTYIYSIEMYDKQKLLYDTAKDCQNVLEIGTYMGHSLLIMLLSNPKLKATCIDIDDTYSRPAIDYLRKEFPNSQISFLHGSSLDKLLDINEKFDLFHIDGSHTNDIISKEFSFCRNMSSSNSLKIIFDDAESCLPLLDQITKEYVLINKIIPNCKWYNAFVEISLKS